MVKPHAPDVGRLARVLGPFKITGIFWYRFHHWGVRVAPAWAYAPLIHAMTAFFWVALRKIGAAIASNLTPVLGEATWFEKKRRIHRTLLSFAWCLTERYERLAVGRDVAFQMEGRDEWERLVASPEGFILITAHIGNWEIGSVAASEQQVPHIHVVREEELEPSAQEFIQGLLDERLGPNYSTHFASHNLGLGLVLFEALRRGEITALQGDRPRAEGAAVEVSLFGRPFPLPTGPFALARMAGVPLLPTFILRKGRRSYRVCFRQAIRVARSSNKKHDMEKTARELAGHLEWAIRQEPHQWFCFKNLWPADRRRS